MSTSFHSHDDEYDGSHEHGHDATSFTNHGPLSKVIPNPLTDTTTTISEGERPTIQSELTATNNDKRPEDSWNSNTLTLTSDPNNPEKEKSFKRMSTSTQLALARQEGLGQDWEEIWEKEREAKWLEKVQVDLKGWRGGNGEPRSNYCPTALPSDASYFNSAQTGTIGKHLPKEILRVERDWSTGEICQYAFQQLCDGANDRFETSFPIELDRRITPAQFQDFVMELNIILISAYSTKAAVVDNLIAIATWWSSLMFRDGHFEKELKRVETLIERRNREIFNPAGLNVLSPRYAALQFLEIEYY